MDVFVDAERRGRTSASIYEQLREAIVTGRLAQGDRLPTSRGLAAELGVARTTITTVYGRLVAEGYVTGRGSAGSYVSYTGAAEPTTPAASTHLRPVDGVATDIADWSQGLFGTRAPRFDLRTGRPDPALFPHPTWRRALVDAASAPPDGYGHPAGLPAVRRTIAQWIGRSRGLVCDADQVLITAGAQQAIHLACRLLVRPGEMVAIEDPGYPPVAALLESLGVRVVPVPVDHDGIVVEHIPSEARIVYVTPSHQSPTGVVMTMQRRQALLDLAAAQGMAVIEDDYDTEYRHGDRPLEPLHRLDAGGSVLYVGTFSKTLSPSLRLGFVVLPAALVEPAAALRSLIDWQPPAVSQRALRLFIEAGHLDRHLRRTRRIYSERHAMVCARLDELVGEGALTAVVPSQAGLHVTALLPPGRTEQQVRDDAAASGVALGHFDACHRWTSRPQGIVVGFGATATEELAEALDRLAVAIAGSPSR